MMQQRFTNLNDNPVKQISQNDEWMKTSS